MKGYRDLTTVGLGAVVLVLAGSACFDFDNNQNAPVVTPCMGLEQLQSRAGVQFINPIPGAGSLADYTISGGSVSPTIPTSCGDAVATRLQESACPICNGSPTQCEPLVEAIFDRLPEACSTCGDGVCLEGTESAFTCAADCGVQCGDGMCIEGETVETCPLDCAQPCGDGVCAGNEDPEICPEDCTFAVGDGLCSMGENPANSPADCGGQTLGQPCEEDADCNGGICDLERNRCSCNTEAGGICATSTCGDGFCQSYENSFACPIDCCGATECNLDEPPVCVGDTVVQCGVGEGSCPAVQPVQECQFGCIDGACVKCPVIEGLQECNPGDPPICRDLGLTWVCRPFPGVPSCHSLEFISCTLQGLICEDGLGCAGAVGCNECDVVDQRRCADDSVTVERCVALPESGCLVWVTEEQCAPGLVCNISGQTGRCL